MHKNMCLSRTRTHARKLTLLRPCINNEKFTSEVVTFLAANTKKKQAPYVCIHTHTIKHNMHQSVKKMQKRHWKEAVSHVTSFCPLAINRNPKKCLQQHTHIHIHTHTQRACVRACVRACAQTLLRLTTPI